VVERSSTKVEFRMDFSRQQNSLNLGFRVNEEEIDDKRNIEDDNSFEWS
jgi:hypothetical protein